MNWKKFDCSNWDIKELPCYFLTKQNKVVLRKYGGSLGKYTHWMPYQKTKPFPRCPEDDRSVELLPCPFCGSDKIYVLLYEGEGSPCAEANCSNCETRMYANDPQELETWWNYRHFSRTKKTYYHANWEIDEEKSKDIGGK